ncbi:MAG TPA: signal recognition particle protein [Chlamydiales bacterium]|nr:signal recognition particle protein [Chlamydiales bacterium]
MFHSLTKKLKNAISSLGKPKTLTEENVGDAVREVRLALLEADVNYSVASLLINRIKEKAIGENVLKSVTPEQQFIKIVHDELITLMGSEEPSLNVNGSPAVILLCGLQGSGKTTHAAKLANYIQKKEKGKKVLLAACDLQRPAAIEQLKKLGESIEVPVFSMPDAKNPAVVAKAALEKAKQEDYQVLIVDSAGRLHLDEELMKELEKVKEVLHPQEVLFVANATMGQDAVKTAAEFDKRVNITGTILSMLDGSARAGAAISIREVTQKPLKFEGIGEKVSDIQLFNPKSMADRILGMGDVINLVKKAEEAFEGQDTDDLEKKLKTANFHYSDYLKQMSMMKKMGPLKGLLGMLPGMSQMGELDINDGEFKKMEAIILSMTPQEREEKVEMDIPRRKRVAKGSGTHLDDVNRMVKGFKKLKQFFKHMPSMKGKGMPNMDEIMKKMGDKKWH